MTYYCVECGGTNLTGSALIDLNCAEILDNHGGEGCQCENCGHTVGTTTVKPNKYCTGELGCGDGNHGMLCPLWAVGEIEQRTNPSHLGGREGYDRRGRIVIITDMDAGDINPTQLCRVGAYRSLTHGPDGDEVTVSVPDALTLLGWLGVEKGEPR